jgi:large subunit ribosomal protein L21
MFAIIEIGGKQYKVKEKDVLRIEKLPAEAGKVHVADQVLLTNDGKATKIGTPYIPGASVDLKVLKTALDDKVIVFKMKAKKRYKRLRGHRQPYTEVSVVKIKA